MNKEIEKKFNEAYQDLRNATDQENTKNELDYQRYNESPCSVCGKSDFIMKYRNVNGKIEGRISGSFSLFGGSISGYIDGETHTDPVLCCRECENERKIEIFKYKCIEDTWDEQLPYMSYYFGIEKDEKKQGKVSGWLQQYGLEVALEIERKIKPWKEFHRFYKYYDNKYPRFNEKEFEFLGLKRKYKVDGYLRPTFKEKINKFINKLWPCSPKYDLKLREKMVKELRKSGYTFHEIMLIVGYKSPQSITKILRK